jgi:hypothetical protein
MQLRQLSQADTDNVEDVLLAALKLIAVRERRGKLLLVRPCLGALEHHEDVRIGSYRSDGANASAVSRRQTIAHT